MVYSTEMLDHQRLDGPFIEIVTEIKVLYNSQETNSLTYDKLSSKFSTIF